MGVIKLFFKQLFKYFDLYEPVSDLKKVDLLEILQEYEKNGIGSKISDLPSNFLILNRIRKIAKRIVIFGIGLGVVLGMAGPGWELYKDYEANKEMKEAINDMNKVASTMYFRENSPVVALDIIEKSLKLDDKNPDTIYLKAFMQSMITVEKIKNLDRPYNKEELIEAQKALASSEFILESDNIDFYSKAYLIKSQSYFALGENKKALNEINNAINYESRSFFYKIRKATILIEMKEYGQALALLNNLEKSVTSNDIKWVYLWQGLAHYELKSDVSVIKDFYEKALKVDNRFHLALMNLGITYSTLDSSEDSKQLALSYYKQVLKIRPNDKKTYYLLGKLYGSLNKYKKAEIYFRKALEEDSTYFSANLWLGMTYYEIKDYSKALKYFEIAHKINPESLEVYLRKAKMYEKMKDIEKANQNYREIFENQEENIWSYKAYISRAKMNIDLKNFKIAYNDLSNAKKLKDFADFLNADFYVTQFQYYKQVDDKIEALKAIDAAINFEKNDNRFKHSYYKAHYLLNLNENIKALEELERVRLANDNSKNNIMKYVLKLEYKILKKLDMESELKQKILEIKQYDPLFNQ